MQELFDAWAALKPGDHYLFTWGGGTDYERIYFYRPEEYAQSGFFCAYIGLLVESFRAAFGESIVETPDGPIIFLQEVQP